MDIQVRNNAEEQRYEIFVEGELVGLADYAVRGDTVLFPHTEIDPEMRGRGLGDVLIRGALDDVRASGRRVKATCWFVAQFLRDHPEYGDLVAA